MCRIQLWSFASASFLPSGCLLLPVLTSGCQLFCYSQSHSRIVALPVFACFHLVSISYDGDGESWSYRWLWVSWCGCWELNWGRVEEHVLLTNESFFSSMLTFHCFLSSFFERLQKVMWLSGSWQHLLLASYHFTWKSKYFEMEKLDNIKFMFGTCGQILSPIELAAFPDLYSLICFFSGYLQWNMWCAVIQFIFEKKKSNTNPRHFYFFKNNFHTFLASFHLILLWIFALLHRGYFVA